MKNVSNTKSESIKALSARLQKDVSLILSDLEKYIVDSDDDFYGVHFDVDLVLEQNYSANFPKISKSKRNHNPSKEFSGKTEFNFQEDRIYNSDFHNVSGKKRLVKNPFEKINTVAKALFSYL